MNFIFAATEHAAETIGVSTEVLVLGSNILLAVVSLWLTMATIKASKTTEKVDAQQQEHLTNALSEALHREQIFAHNNDDPQHLPDTKEG